MMTPEDCREWLKHFLEAWTGHARYIQNITGLSPDDIQVCNDVLSVLKSDIPQKLIEEVIIGQVSKRTLDDAERFDCALNRLRVISLPINATQKKEVEMLGESCISLTRFILEMNLRMHNMMVN